MPDDFNYMWNLKNKINKQAEQKQTRRYKDHFDGCHMGEGSGGLGKKAEVQMVVTEQPQGYKPQHKKYSP